MCLSAQKMMIGQNKHHPSIEGRPCVLMRSLGANDQYLCSLEFPFRSDDARATYDKYVDEIRGCLGEDKEVPVGPAVNHPDSYDQTVFAVRGRQISVALKDKGALQKTYVFVRLPAN
jgi:hypothetical protein